MFAARAFAPTEHQHEGGHTASIMLGQCSGMEITGISAWITTEYKPRVRLGLTNIYMVLVWVLLL